MRKWISVLLALLFTASLLFGCTQAEPENLRDELDEAEASIAALQAQNQELTSEIQELNSLIETLQQQVSNLNAVKELLVIRELREVATKFSQTIGSPVTFLEASYNTTVDSENRNDIVDDIIEATAILNIDRGTFSGVSFLKDTVLPTVELNDYRNGLLDIVTVGDYVVKVDWEMHDGTKFSTLALVDKYGTPEFEPILYFAPGEVQVKEEWGSAPSSSTDHWWEKTWSHDTALGTNAVTVKIRLTIICDDETCKIISQSLTVTFSTGLFWKADKVEKETPYIAPSQTCPGGITECKKGEVKIAWASGFKKLKVKAKEYEIEVEGTLGSNGEIEFVMDVCCDGTYPGLPEQVID